MNVQTIWNEFLIMAREEVGSRVVDTWFTALSIGQWDSLAKILSIQVPNAFVKEWVSTKYRILFERCFGRLLHETKVEIAFLEGDELAQAAQVLRSPLASLEVIAAVRAPQRIMPRQQEQHDVGMLRGAYVFDNFIVGPHNSLAYAAAQAIIDNLGTLYNPFFMYGRSGLGKTHLLHAIGNAARKKCPQLRIIYQSANRFVSDFIAAIRFDKVYQFEAQYKNINLLLIDDVQFLANKEQTQEAFFHLFNALHHAQRQIVCTSDSLPHDIAGLADRVRSRLSSGLVTDISQPTLETKIAIVKRKAETHGECIGDEVAEFIALTSTSNVRNLEGALIRVFAYASLHAQKITIELARAALTRQENGTEPKERIDLESILSCVARQFEYTVDALRSKERRQEIAFARQIAMFLMKKLTTKSLREIGCFLLRRDHSTVLHAIQKIDKLQKNDVNCARILKALEQQLNALHR